jgi:hypothetical protein
VENHESFLRKLTIKATLDPEFAEVTAAIAASGPPTPLLYHVTRVLADVENWEAVLGKIATNPQVLATMWGMHPHQSKLYLEGIAADLSNKPEDHAEESRSTKPPAPINPVRKVGATATGLSDDVPVEEWARRRNAQVAKQRGLR